MNKQPPYIITTRIVEERAYNPEYGDDQLCRCGHQYYRHFDTWEDMAACGCKYCDCSEFKEGGTLFTEEYVAPVVGGMSLVSVRGNPPHAHANYFWLECGSRVLNFWAENLEAAVKQFGLKKVAIRRYKGHGYDVCLIDEPSIPKEWYLTKLCFTGSKIPPLEILEDIFQFGDTTPLGFENELEQFTDPASYYAKKGWSYDPKTGIVSIPVNATPKKLQCSWTIETAKDFEISFDKDGFDDAMDEMTRAINCDSPPEISIVQVQQPQSSIIMPPERRLNHYDQPAPKLTDEQWDSIRLQVEQYVKDNKL